MLGISSMKPHLYTFYLFLNVHDLPKLPRLSPNLRSYFSLFNGWYCHWDGRYVPASISIKQFSVLMFVSMQYYSGDNKQNLFHSAN